MVQPIATPSAKSSPQPARSQPQQLPAESSTDAPISPPPSTNPIPAAPVTLAKPAPVQPSSGDWRADRIDKEAKEKAAKEAKAKEREEREKAAKANEGATSPVANGEGNAAAPPRGQLAPRGNAWARGGKAAGPGAHFPPRNVQQQQNQGQASGQNQQQNQGQNQRRGAPPEGNQWRRGPAPPQARNAPAAPAQIQQPPARSQPAEPVIDEDGFTVASGPGARKQQAQQASKVEKKEGEGRNTNKFSFAAASGVDDFVEDGDVEGVTSGVKDVAV